LKTGLTTPAGLFHRLKCLRAEGRSIYFALGVVKRDKERPQKAKARRASLRASLSTIFLSAEPLSEIDKGVICAR
jgi:hypothetical protein